MVEEIKDGGVVVLPKNFQCTAAEFSTTNWSTYAPIPPGSTLWVWDINSYYVFANGDWRPI